jgi:RNA polymerase sigma-70 factor (ECF subfamily)
MMEQQQFRFEEEILPYRERLLAYARRLLGDENEAEDIVQEVILKLWHIRDELCRYRNVRALAFTVAKNLCLNVLKRRRRIQSISNAELQQVDENLTPENRVELNDSVENVMHLIGRLPELQQLILRMRHVEEMEIDEIAALTGGTPESVRMNLSRARKRVKEWFLNN